MKNQIELSFYGLYPDIDKKLRDITSYLEAIKRHDLQMILHTIKPRTYFLMEKIVSSARPYEKQNKELGFIDIEDKHIFYIADLLNQLKESDLIKVLLKVHPQRFDTLKYFFLLSYYVNEKIILSSKKEVNL